jgi:hypothetical protein
MKHTLQSNPRLRRRVRCAFLQSRLKLVRVDLPRCVDRDSELGQLTLHGRNNRARGIHIRARCANAIDQRRELVADLRRLG